MLLWMGAPLARQAHAFLSRQGWGLAQTYSRAVKLKTPPEVTFGAQQLSYSQKEFLHFLPHELFSSHSQLQKDWMQEF